MFSRGFLISTKLFRYGRVWLLGGGGLGPGYLKYALVDKSMESTIDGNPRGNKNRSEQNSIGCVHWYQPLENSLVVATINYFWSNTSPFIPYP